MPTEICCGVLLVFILSGDECPSASQLNQLLITQVQKACDREIIWGKIPSNDETEFEMSFSVLKVIY